MCTAKNNKQKSTDT